MKKMMLVILVPYLVLIGIIFYIYFGPGLIGYQPLKWKGIETTVPGGFKVKTYQGKGWEVYSMKKLTVLIKIALKSAVIDVSRLPGHARKVLYRFSSEPGEIYYISNPRKVYEVVFARTITMDDDNSHMTLYFSASSASVFSSRYIVNKIAGNTFYKGRKIKAPEPSIPLKCYLTDFIFLGGMLLPILIIGFIFYLSGKKPAEKHFIGDPIRYEESYVFYRSIRKFRRKSSFCYLVLTARRLMVFLFKRCICEIKIYEEKPDLKIEGNNIIVQKEKERIILRPKDIEKWKELLHPFLSQPGKRIERK